MKTKLIQKIKEEYFKRQPTRDLLFEGKESPRAEFGYKVRRGNEIFTVVDWGNIWNFIEKAISQSKEEMVEEIKFKIRKHLNKMQYKIKSPYLYDYQTKKAYNRALENVSKFILEDLNKI